MPFYAVQQDITTMQVDAIVNAANTGLLPGGGVCGAIFAKAGYEDMAAACKAIGGCPTGQAVITPGFALPAAYVIHTPGPVWRGGGQGEARVGRLLRKQPSPRPKVRLPLHRLSPDLRRDLWLSPSSRLGNRRGYHTGLAKGTSHGRIPLSAGGSLGPGGPAALFRLKAA